MVATLTSSPHYSGRDSITLYLSFFSGNNTTILQYSSSLFFYPSSHSPQPQDQDRHVSESLVQATTYTSKNSLNSLTTASKSYHSLEEDRVRQPRNTRTVRPWKMVCVLLCVLCVLSSPFLLLPFPFLSFIPSFLISLLVRLACPLRDSRSRKRNDYSSLTRSRVFSLDFQREKETLMTLILSSSFFTFVVSWMSRSFYPHHLFLTLFLLPPHFLHTVKPFVPQFQVLLPMSKS